MDDTRLLQLNNGKTEILILIIGEDPIFQISNSLGSLSDSVTHQKAQKLELLDFGMTCRRRSGLLPQFHLLSHFLKPICLKQPLGDCICFIIVFYFLFSVISSMFSFACLLFDLIKHFYCISVLNESYY